MADYYPGGTPIYQQAGIGTAIGGAVLGEGIDLLQNYLGGQGGAGGACPTMFRAAPSTVARPIKHLTALNPVTGRCHHWEEKGRPVLYASDITACKRVARVARMARATSRKVSAPRKRRR